MPGTTRRRRKWGIHPAHLYVRTYVSLSISRQGIGAQRARGGIVSQMSIWYRTAVAFAGLALLVGLLAGCGETGITTLSKSLCIATDFPASGTDGALGKPAQNAVDLAVSQAKLHSGYTVSVTHFNDAVNGVQSSVQGATNLTNMVSDPCILAVLGPLDDTVAAAEMPIAANSSLAMISPGVTNPALTKEQDAPIYGLDYDTLHPAGKPTVFFRLPATDDTQGAAGARLAIASGWKRAYVVSDGAQAGAGLAAFFTQAFTAQGGTVAGHETIPGADAAHLAAVAGRIKAANAAVVYYAGQTPSAATLRAAMGSAGLTAIPLLAAGGVAGDATYVQVAGPSAAEGTIATSALPDPQSLTSPAAQQFARDYQAKFGAAPTALSAYAYDAANIALAAINAVIDAGQAPIRTNVLARITHSAYQGVTGYCVFDAHGDNSGAGGVSEYQVKAGMWVYLKQVTP
jgi:branched-chain amino acid transport system substrate-binding protein